MSKSKMNTNCGVLIGTLALVMMAGFAMSSVVAAKDYRGKAVKQKTVKYKNLKVLPKGHSSVRFKNNRYYFNQGQWYRKSNGLYLGIRAPIGAILFGLPNGYTTLSIGSNRYYHLDGTYYRSDSSGYVVVNDPTGIQHSAASQQPAASQQEDQTVQQGSRRLIVYPAAGQSREETGRDKYECYEWAILEAHYDPVSSESDPQLESDYRRAITACLEARNYVVK